MRGSNDQFLILETKLHKALRENIFELRFQPTYNLQSGKIIGTESIIYWHDEDYGEMNPVEFLPFAAQCGLIIEIDQYTLKHTIQQMAQLKPYVADDFKISVDLSTDYLKDTNFIVDLTTYLEETQLEPHYIEIEISELSLLDTDLQLYDKINQLHEMGISISVDDFGMGYSSLSYLREIPINLLKIDQLSTHELNLVPANAKMVAVGISLANALNIQVVATKVENGEDLAILKELNCAFVQGLYLNDPLPLQELIAFIAKH